MPRSMLRRDERRRFRMEDPETRDPHVRLPRPRPPAIGGLVVGVGGFIVGWFLTASFWGGFLGAVLALLIWGGWGLRR
jgi:hypothetical protein